MNKIYPLISILFIILIWQILCSSGIVPAFMLPTPMEVLNALIEDSSSLLQNAYITLFEAFVGMSISLILAFILAIIMDNSKILTKLIYPLLIMTQTIPVVAIAPLLVLWLGYGLIPKIVLIVIVCFFPLTIGLYSGLKSVDEDMLNLLKSFDANKFQEYVILKIPYSLKVFLPSLKISASYSIVGAVISEWLGGEKGLGVYMTMVRKSYSFDKMFAVIIVIMVLSLILISLLNILEKYINKKIP